MEGYAGKADLDDAVASAREEVVVDRCQAVHFVGGMVLQLCRLRKRF